MGQNLALAPRRQQAQWHIGWKPARLLAVWRFEGWWDRLGEAERGRFALWLPVFMGAGVLAYYALRQEPPDWIGAKIAVAGFAAGMASRNWRILRAIGFSAGFAALGFASAQYATARLPPIEADLPASAMIATGTVRSVEVLSPGRRITLSGVELTADDTPPARPTLYRVPAPAGRGLTRTARYRLMAGDDTAIETGDTVRVRAISRPPLPPALPGGWDTQRDAFFAGLGASGYALGRVEITARGAPDRFASRVQWLRETIARRVTAAIPGAPGAVAVTLLTGASRGIPEADHAAFRESGLAHLLAVAGLHIGIVMGFALGAARTMLALSERASLFWPAKQIACVLALGAGGAYMMLTGAHVPIVRSFAMACLFTVAVLAGRRAFSLRGWALAMAAVVLMSPDAVLGVSFQMSFSAVLALIAGYDTLRPFLTRIGEGGGAGRRLLRILLGLAITSVLAGTASAPFAAYHFGKIQLYFVLANLAAVPLTAFWIMPAGLLALALMPLHLEALALMPMAYGERAVLWIARTVAALPDATLAAPPMPGWGLVLVALGMAWLGLWRTRLRLAGMAVLAAGLLSPLAMRPPDVLVSADARLIGLRTAHGVFVQATKGAQHFEREAWEAFWAAGPVRPLPEQGPTGDVVCDAAACRWRTAGGPLVVVARGPPDQAVCGAALLLSAEPVRVDCVPRIAVIDRFSVWRDGAYAAWIAPDGVRTLSDRAVRGSRPWVAVPTRSRSIGGLPLAPAETLPPE